MDKLKLFGKSLKEIKNIVRHTKLPSYTAKQISDWLYKKNIASIDEMTNLSKIARSKLNERYMIGLNNPVKVDISEDGTKKYLFSTITDKFVEAVYIPDEDRHTLCLSSQAGCKMRCNFCLTGKQGFQGNLDPGEILNQYTSLPERDLITNIVYMGMGEPLDNHENVLKSLEIFTSDYGMAKSPRRITVSTIGITKVLKEFIDNSDCHIALSVQNPFNQERGFLVPVQKTNPISELMEILKNYDWKQQRRISFEYIMFKGINDTDTHLKKLIRLLSDLYCRVNLIRYHKIPGVSFEPSEEVRMFKFRDKLNEKGIITTIRRSRGKDISAACGMLSSKEISDS